MLIKVFEYAYFKVIIYLDNKSDKLSMIKPWLLSPILF